MNCILLVFDTYHHKQHGLLQGVIWREEIHSPFCDMISVVTGANIDCIDLHNTEGERCKDHNIDIL